MSQENVDVIRRAIVAFNAGDIEQMLALAACDCESEQTAG